MPKPNNCITHTLTHTHTQKNKHEQRTQYCEKITAARLRQELMSNLNNAFIQFLFAKNFDQHFIRAKT